MSLWVIKIGTSLLRGNKDISTKKAIETFSTCIAECKKEGNQVVLVTSGAVGLGCSCLGIKHRPVDIVSLQAAAAIGQGQLMALYQEAMSRHSYQVAQVLITRTDLESRSSYQNASATLKKLLEWDVLAVVNENDTLSSEELRYGDNDTLSALVASAIQADQLILLTDVDKLYSSDPRKDLDAKPISDVHQVSDLELIGGGNSKAGTWGTGGIQTKLAAAKIATASGITVHLADGRNPEILSEILNGSRGGTVFHPHPEPLANKKSWLAHVLIPIGNIFIDKGACDAIIKRGASLLLVGIKSIEGSFSANQPVKVLSQNGVEIARGISSLCSEDLKEELQNRGSTSKSPVVIHRDVLVLTSKNRN